MRKVVIRKSVVSLATVMLLLLSLAGTALATHQWGSNHWASENLTMTVSDNGFDGAATSDMLDVWRAGNPLNPTFIGSGVKGDIDVVSGRSMLWLGRAQIWVDGSGHITKGQVKMNTTLLASYPAEATTHVLCQELGHVFGLTHNGQNSCMNDSLNTLGNYPYPNAHDYEMLNFMYSHLDSGGGGDGGGDGGGPDCPPTSNSPRCNTQASGRWVTVHTFWVSDYQR